MSAFIVCNQHIDALVTLGQTHDVGVMPTPYAPGMSQEAYAVWIASRKESRGDADWMGQMLLDECVASVAYRYPGDQPSELPGPISSEWLLPYSFKLVYRPISPVQGLKLLSCYEYQSCEHPEWKDSVAKQFCENLKSMLISALPGYSEARWEYEVVSA